MLVDDAPLAIDAPDSGRAAAVAGSRLTIDVAHPIEVIDTKAEFFGADQPSYVAYPIRFVFYGVKITLNCLMNRSLADMGRTIAEKKDRVLGDHRQRRFEIVRIRRRLIGAQEFSQ